LDKGQGVDFGMALIDQAHRQIRGHLAAKQARRLTDGAQQGFVTDPRQQVLGSVDELGESR
jgi:hypothetical protein